MSDKPICYDLYCRLGGWAEGFLAEGYECIGFDIEAHDYGTGGYPGELRIRDVRSIHGSELKDATCIVGSSPCQEFSYRAMPWKRAKALPPPYLGMELFNAQFRIQREACEAAGRYIPMVVENVRGAQKWVGRAQWHYGSFYLWGDVPALMPQTVGARKIPPGISESIRQGKSPARWTNPDEHYFGPKEGRKVSMNFHEHEKTGKPGRSFQSAAVEEMGVKQGGDWFGKNCESSMSRLYGSKSQKRKMASAMIAKIPVPAGESHCKVFQITDRRMRMAKQVDELFEAPEAEEQPAKKQNLHVVIALRHLNKRRGVLLEKRAAVTKEIEELDAAILALE